MQVQAEVSRRGNERSQPMQHCMRGKTPISLTEKGKKLVGVTVAHAAQAYLTLL